MKSIFTTSALMQSEMLVSRIKKVFEQELTERLNLQKVNAPLFVPRDSGLNDDLNGIERPVSFLLEGREFQIVHSLAKWKRWYLGELGVEAGMGIVTDMKAIRADEVKSPIHSHLVDQWDWEKVILKEQRTIETLIEHGKSVYASLKSASEKVEGPVLPEEVFVLHAEDLLKCYPTLSAKEREYEIAKEKRAVLLLGIGGKLSNGIPHDLRAPDYDDWSTKDELGRPGINADLIVWDEVRKDALEISSMGVRVDEKALEHQLELTNETKRLKLSFHSKLLKGELPYTIGGGIGQSRVAMYLARRSHIEEVQPTY